MPAASGVHGVSETTILESWSLSRAILPKDRRLVDVAQSHHPMYILFQMHRPLIMPVNV